jgi:hypothetical protein
MGTLIVILSILFSVAATANEEERALIEWISPFDERIELQGDWEGSRYRYANATSLSTADEGASLTVKFQGSGAVIRFGQQKLPVYGGETHGRVVVYVDGEETARLVPREEALEVVVFRRPQSGDHTLRLVHQADRDLVGVRVEGIGIWGSATGEVSFSVHGQEHAHLVDTRVTVRRAGQVVRETIDRNWLSGQCRLAGLPQGSSYSVGVEAIGWQPWESEPFEVAAGRETKLPPVYLRRDSATNDSGVRTPRIGRPAIVRSGESFETRLLGYGGTVERVELRRQVGPATISRVVSSQDLPERAFYYDIESAIAIPKDTPPGLYDLIATVSNEWGVSTRKSPRSVHVVRDYPQDPVFMTFGHYDTWGQYQAEYLEGVAATANLLGVDAVLVSNAVNPAYISGALSVLNVPYLITFGNHQYAGHEKWYGHPIGLVDFGPNMAILNFGLAWHEDRSPVLAALESRRDVALKLINALEHNAPVDEILDAYEIAFIHDAHGPGTKVMQIGKTPTQRAGKANSESFRLIRFRENRVVSCTYAGDDQAPIPFSREGPALIRVSYDVPNDGSHNAIEATIVNELKEDFPDCRLTFVLVSGDYSVSEGQIESIIPSDDGRYAVVTVRVDVAKKAQQKVRVRRRTG